MTGSKLFWLVRFLLEVTTHEKGFCMINCSIFEMYGLIPILVSKNRNTSCMHTVFTFWHVRFADPHATVSVLRWDIPKGTARCMISTHLPHHWATIIFRLTNPQKRISLDPAIKFWKKLVTHTILGSCRRFTHTALRSCAISLTAVGVSKIQQGWDWKSKKNLKMIKEIM